MDTTVVHRITGDDEYVYHVAKGASCVVVFYARENKTLSLSVSVHLDGEGANATVVGVVEAGKNARVTMHTLQHHNAPKTTSNLLVKSVLTDDAVVSYSGDIRVEKIAQRTNAYQRNENLLLSEGAKATSEPALEILANDVRCTHGAIVKTLDANELWYMASRGIPENEASSLIRTGFLSHAFSIVEDGIERAKLERKVVG
jgi:Fe-S cluster assembly protein SufD